MKIGNNSRTCILWLTAIIVIVIGFHLIFPKFTVSHNESFVEGATTARLTASRTTARATVKPTTAAVRTTARPTTAAVRTTARINAPTVRTTVRPTTAAVRTTARPTAAKVITKPAMTTVNGLISSREYKQLIGSTGTGSRLTNVIGDIHALNAPNGSSIKPELLKATQNYVRSVSAGIGKISQADGENFIKNINKSLSGRKLPTI